MSTSKPPFLRTAYNYDTMEISNSTSLLCSDPSLAKQQFADESNINTIVERFGLTGQLPSDVAMPQSGDFTGLTDFKSAMDMVTATQQEFLRIPAHLRDRFANDPQRLISFLDNPENRPEAERLGLVNPLPVKQMPEGHISEAKQEAFKPQT